MGWDAYAVTKDGKALFEFDYERGKGLIIKDRVYARAFKNASDAVFQKAGTVDGLLLHGGLDCSPCAYALEQLTGIDAWGEALSVERVQELTTTEYEPEDDYKWAYYSALEFLRVCQEQKLGIQFSW